MKHIILSLWLSLLSIFAFAQNAEYSGYIAEASRYLQSKEYQKAADAYSKAFKAFGNKGLPVDRYNAACAWARIGNADSAFLQLNKLVAVNYYQFYSDMLTDPDLLSLHQDKRWAEVCNALKAVKDKLEANMNKPLMAKLDTIYHDDQDGRRQLDEVEKKYGRDSKEIKELWKDISYKDSVDLVIVESILDQYGWLGSMEIGWEANNTLFLVIQHADIKTQEKYLPMMRDAVKKGKAQPSALALLEDRVALREGKKQIYGSQIGRNMQTGEYYVSPLEDPDNVDKRRASVGLEPLANYVKNWGMNWNVEAYKKKLAEIEANEAKIIK